MFSHLRRVAASTHLFNRRSATRGFLSHATPAFMVFE